MDVLLSLEQISFSRGERAILRDVSWRVQRGEVAAILGANGCGKSTLLRIISGYLWAQRGRVRLFGETFGEVALPALRARVGIVEATTVYPFDEGMTARDVVVSGYFSALTVGYVSPTGAQWGHAEELLGRVGLAGKERQGYFTMSTGERLRCLLARALVRKPELLLLDEPTAGLDLPGREAILATLARLHRGWGAAAPAMITITHHLEELLPETANVLLLSREGGVVAAGRPEGVLTGTRMTEAYGVPIEVTRRDGRYAAHVDPGLWDVM
ncbi:MAG TPA: ATP-binding cassette domain-containing protein [Phycisphaerae bacterium]|nr:ATP-binding cassette domain-containing protein [Phycisphaerae bacterium]